MAKKEALTCNPLMLKRSHARLKSTAALIGMSLMDLFELLSNIPVATIKALKEKKA